MRQQPGTVLRPGSASRTVEEAQQWQPWRNSIIMTQCLTRESLPAPQENYGKFSNSARKPPKTT